jgi:hypothetical protein
VTVTAVRKDPQRLTMVLQDVQVPVPGPGKVRIRVASTPFIDDFAVAAASERVGSTSQAAAWRVTGLTSARLRGVQA